MIRDRAKHLSEDGVLVPIIAIDKHTGKIESQPWRSSLADSCPLENGQEIRCRALSEVILRHCGTIEPRVKKPTGASSRKKFASTSAATSRSNTSKALP